MSTPVEDILNWRRWSDKITLSGQPSEAQLSALADSGVTHVINLGPHSNDGALTDEPASVAALDMQYIYIPVEFDTPTEADFTAFDTALDSLSHAKIHVHCIYNARVSAFMFKRAAKMNARSEEAFQIMDGIWKPGTVWARLLGIAPTSDGKNQYAGYEY